MNDLAQVPAARSIYNHVFAEPQVRDGGGIEVVNLANFRETYTDNVRLHRVNYTVSEINEPMTGGSQPETHPVRFDTYL